MRTVKAEDSPWRQRAISASSGSLSTITPGGVESWDLFGGLDLEDLVEARVLEDVLEVAVHAREPELALGGHEALLRLEQDSQAGAGDVFQLGAVHGHRAFHAVEERLRRGTLGCVQPPCDDDFSVGAVIDREHFLFSRACGDAE